MTTYFGSDISCTNALRTGRRTTGVRLVAEAAYRRLTTRRGTLRGGPAEENYGMDLNDYVQAEWSADLPARLSIEVQNELSKDQRIESTDVRVERTEGAGLRMRVYVACTTSEGPFTLQIGIDDVSVELLEVT